MVQALAFLLEFETIYCRWSGRRSLEGRRSSRKSPSCPVVVEYRGARKWVIAGEIGFIEQLISLFGILRKLDQPLTKGPIRDPTDY